MSLKKRVYSVLIVSAAEAFRSALTPLLPETAYEPVRFVSGVSAAKRALAERDFDFVLVNSPLPDGPGISFAMDTCASGEAVVLLLVKRDIYDAVCDKAEEQGLFLLQKPTTKAVLLQALSWLASARERIRRFEKKNLSIEKKMEEIRLVNRAKWLLISRRGLTEEDAHHYIEKQAMNSCTTKKHAAEEIIRTFT